MIDCIFCKIIKREIPANIVYEDEKILCFKDIAPQAPVHLVVIPKNHFPDLLTVKDEEIDTICHLIKKISHIAAKEGLEPEGFRLVNNCKEMAGQSVFHLHFHILGGRVFSWPPG